MKCIDDEIPFEIPQSWCWERWGNISFSIQYGFNAPAIESGDIKMVRISDIHDNKVNWKDVPYCKISQSEIDTYLLQEHDILFARTGGTVGKSFLMGAVSEPAIYAGYLIRTRYSKELCPQYLKSFMESSLYWEQLRTGTIATAQPNCNGKTLGRMLLPIPPKIEQNRITSILQTIESSLDKYTLAQEALGKLNADIFDKLKKSVLQEAIQGRLVPQDPNDESASVLLERIKAEKTKLFRAGKLKKKDLVDSVIFKGEDNKYYEKVGKATIDIGDEIHYDIPNSWAWARLQSICKITNGFTPLRSEERFWKGGSINWFTVDDIHEQGEYITETKQRITQEATSEERIVRAGSVLLCCTASIGQCAITRIATTTNQQFNALTIKDEYRDILDDEYLFLFAKTLKDELNRLAGTTTFAFVSVKKVGNILIPIPPIIEQKRIVDIVKKSISSIMSR